VKKIVYLVSYPRSGNTLVRTYFSILQGRPQLSIYRGDVIKTSSRALTRALAHVRLIKSHTFPSGSHDIIYLVRDGRNAMISHLYLMFLWKGHHFWRLEEISEAIEYLSNEGHFWGDHVRAALAQTGRRNICFIKYEDLARTPAQALAAMVRFMGVSVPDSILDECIRLAAEDTTYFRRPGSGYLYEPEPNSIYDMLKKHRREDYWRKIFNSDAMKYFHEHGGTEFLMRFGYEKSAAWWQEVL
jgi:Sulfotransferase domain